MVLAERNGERGRGRGKGEGEGGGEVEGVEEIGMILDEKYIRYHII